MYTFLYPSQGASAETKRKIRAGSPALVLLRWAPSQEQFLAFGLAEVSVSEPRIGMLRLPALVKALVKIPLRVDAAGQFMRWSTCRATLQKIRGRIRDESGNAIVELRVF